ncbi:MAG: alpha/beta hydrolase, partial [Demequina sp.]|nr:alpha/beta hydrolase [Demequina sp.]
IQGIVQMVRLSAAGVRDTARGLRNLAPHYVPAFGLRGSLAAMTREGEFEAAQRLYPADCDISRVVAARVFLTMSSYSPGRKAAKVKAPWLIQIASRDVTTPPGPARSAARRAPEPTLIEYDAGHFDPYVPPLFDRVVGDQISFLRSHLR